MVIGPIIRIIDFMSINELKLRCLDSAMALWRVYLSCDYNFALRKSETYDIEEYRTWKLYHRTQTEMGNVSYKSKRNNKIYELHSDLTSNLRTIRKGGV